MHDIWIWFLSFQDFIVEHGMFKVNTKSAGTWERIDEYHALQIRSKSCKDPWRSDLVSHYMEIFICFGWNMFFWCFGKISIQFFQARLLEREDENLMNDVSLFTFQHLQNMIHPPDVLQKRDYFNRICSASEKPWIFRGTAVSFRGSVSMILIVISCISCIQAMKRMIFWRFEGNS